MKKLFRTFMVMSLATATIFTACKKDDDSTEETIDDVKASLTTTSTSSVLINSSVKLVIEATGNDKNKVTKVTVTSSMENKALLDTTITGTTSFTKTIDKVLDKTGTHVFTVTVTGEKGSPATASTTITVNTPSVFKTLGPTSNQAELGAQLRGPQFMDLVSGNIYDYNDNGTKEAQNNSQLVDIGYGYGSENAATLFGPADNVFLSVYGDLSDWSTRNATKIAVAPITTAQFDAATNDSLIQIHGGLLTTTTSGFANKLGVDQVLIFKTGKNPSKVGMIRITALTPGSGTGGADHKIQFVYKIEQ